MLVHTKFQLLLTACCCFVSSISSPGAHGQVAVNVQNNYQNGVIIVLTQIDTSVKPPKFVAESWLPVQGGGHSDATAVKPAGPSTSIYSLVCLEAGTLTTLDAKTVPLNNVVTLAVEVKQFSGKLGLAPTYIVKEDQDKDSARRDAPIQIRLSKLHRDQL